MLNKAKDNEYYRFTEEWGVSVSPPVPRKGFIWGFEAGSALWSLELINAGSQNEP